MSAEGGRKAIIAALAANLGIAVAKFVGYALTGSSSMLAEGVHSVADTSNQALLLRGQAAAKRAADQQHPFGYGRSRYFYAFIVALVIFVLGAMFAILEGVEKIHEPHELENPWIGVVILGVAVLLEGYSFTTAWGESRKSMGGQSLFQFIRHTRNPELPVVLLEDAGALVGLMLALGGVGMSLITGDPVWDGIATLCIGVLLAAIALVLIVEMGSLLIGEGATPEQQRQILLALQEGPEVERVIHCRTLYLGPEELLVAAKVAVSGASDLATVSKAVDAAEARLRERLPEIDLIYIEPDVDRGARPQNA
ncbi:cation diffusion facilitator family transporter [Segniliparus rugosus]|uniref:Cation diffusion facilitator family transporter n=1 Tax=Segniliparus rugosus (strain ATCC BAA-974 / DSM 45345 / CCUG 50838 / CIP 108380 / JCM 13579 / CDC 945) TaxID=679197 RepID=E5XLE2_SEGRC|nr:cation diffusion facilitator family transporter [Segniliparus rugosus]EFV14825.1 cation diffusion facilitator family transporter [Segniliparus rugosus ATCC BAA-974]